MDRRAVLSSSGALAPREAERASLGAGLADARAGRARFVLVHGEQGMGKTTLVRQFLSDAGDACVLAARADESERGLSYATVEHLGCSARPHLPAELAALGDRSSPPPAPHVVGAALVQWLDTVQQRSPVVVVVDDAHLADAASQTALLYGLRRLPRARLLVVLAARDDRLTWLVDGLGKLVDGDAGTRLSLGGLDGSAIKALGSALGFEPLPRSFVERLREHTGGNPSHVRALLDEVGGEGIDSTAHLVLPAPASIRTAVAGRLAHCSRDGRRLAAAAAVVGMRCPLGLARRLAGMDEALAAVQAAVDARLVEYRAHEVAFANPLVRAAVYHSIPIPERVALHAAAARLVDDEPARLGHQVAAASEEDEALAARTAELAHRAAAQGSWTEASATYVQAARLASGARRAGYLLDAVECLLTDGDAASAEAIVTTLDRRVTVFGTRTAATVVEPGRPVTALPPHTPGTVAEPGRPVTAVGPHTPGTVAEPGRPVTALPPHTPATALEPDRPEGDARALYLRGRLARCTGRADEADRLLADARRACREPGLAAEIALELAGLHIDRLRPAEGATWADAAVACVAGSSVALRPFPCAALALALSGRAPDALALLASVDRTVGGTDADATGLLLGRAVARLYAGDIAGAGEDAARAVAIARRRGPPAAHAYALAMLAFVEYRLGQWDGAVAHAELGVSVVEDGDLALLRSTLHAAAAWPLAGRGLWDAAEAHVRGAAEGSRGPWDRAMATMALAVLEHTRGHHRSVVDAVTSLLALGGRGALSEPDGLWPWQEPYIEAALSEGRLALAEDELCRFDALASSRGSRSATATAARLLGALEAARGRDREASAAFLRATELAGAGVAPLDRARAQLAYGSFLRRAGKRAAAVTELRAARECFDGLGARPSVERCDRELAATGRTPRRARAARTGALTPQEASVARLVVRGRSNRQVAAELVVSVNTVEYHLKNVYAKLGVGSRTQLALRLPAADRGDGPGPA